MRGGEDETHSILAPRSVGIAFAISVALIYSTQSGDLMRALPDVAPITDFPYARAALASISDALLMLTLVSLVALRSPAFVLSLAGVFAAPWRPLLWGLIALAPALVACLALASTAPDVEAADIVWKAIGGPVTEELVYRGLAIGVLVRLCGWSMWGACLWPAIFFGAVHIWQGEDFGSILGIVAITGLGGLLFGWLFVRWGFNLWPPILLHVGLNALWLIFDLGENAIGGWLGNGLRLSVVAIAIAATFWLAPRGERRARVAEGAAA